MTTISVNISTEPDDFWFLGAIKDDFEKAITEYWVNLIGDKHADKRRLKSILEKVQEDLEGPTYTLPLWFYEILLYEIAPDWRFEDSNHLTEMYFDIERLVKKYRNAERYGVSTQGLIDNRDK